MRYASLLRTTGLLSLLAFALVACGSSSPVAPPSSGASSLTPGAADSLVLRAKALIRSGNNAGAVDSLRRARALAKRATGPSAHPALAHYYAALADFRLINLLPDDAESRRERVIRDGISHLKRAVDLDAQMADAWALLAGCYGRMMGMNPMKGMSLGPKANEAIEQAKTLAPKNPRVWIVSGTHDFYTPRLFGGDKERALEKFKKAARLAEQDPVDDPLMPDWGHAEAHAWIGIAHMNAERYDQARTAFEAALDINPDYGWVKSVLLPRLNEQQS
jgi:tetratricopeptide (TPR) repeat protein